MDSRTASVLENVFPDREVDDVGSTGPSWNEKNRTMEIDFADGETIYLKMAIDGDGSRIARERAVLAYAGSNYVVSVPAVVASDTGGQVPYLASAPMAGQSFLELWSAGDVKKRAVLAQEVGRSLASVHTLRFENHGRIVGGDRDTLELDVGPWTDVLVETIVEMRAIVPSDRFDHHFDAVIAAVDANRALLDDAPAALLHGDPAQPNCYRGPAGVGFLDWERAHVGDPVRDIYRTRDQVFDSLRTEGPDQIVSAFYDGYRERAGRLPAGFEDRRPVYEAVRFLGTSGFYKKMAAFVDEPPEEFARWVRAEMDRRLAKIQ